jgi:hypothetical protein
MACHCNFNKTTLRQNQRQYKYTPILAFNYKIGGTIFIYLLADSLLGMIRGVIDLDDSNYILGEKDMMLKLVLPYLNEFLSKLKALMVPC